MGKSVPEYGSLQLTCRGTGYPSVGVMWFKDGTYFTDNVYRHPFSGDSVLNITSASVNDTGSYLCQFSTTAGHLNSSVAKIVVVGKPLYMMAYSYIYFKRNVILNSLIPLILKYKLIYPCIFMMHIFLLIYEYS